MALDRAKRLAILNAASDENLAMALQAIGIEDTDEAMDPYGEGQENSVPTWNELEVSVPSSTRGPLVSKERLFVPKQSFTTNEYGLQEPGDQEALMSSVGMV